MDSSENKKSAVRTGLIFGFGLYLASCAAISEECSVYAYSDEYDGNLVGLVDLFEEFEARLRNQLPDEMRTKRACWYTRDNKIIAHIPLDGGSPGNKSWYGQSFEFSFQNARWTLTTETVTIGPI